MNFKQKLKSLLNKILKSLKNILGLLMVASLGFVIMVICSPSASFVIEIKESVYAAGLAITFGCFIWKLYADNKIARYRESIAFIEKKDKSQTNLYNYLLLNNKTDEKLKNLLSNLELAALLINKNVFESEVIYISWWKHFHEPYKWPEFNAWMEKCLDEDKNYYKNYRELSSKWKSRIEEEQKK